MKFITGNSNKLREVQAILGNHIIQWDIDLPEIQSLDSQEVLNHKIQSTLDSLNETEKQIPFFLEDTSLTFHALGKFPGPLIKRVLSHEGATGAYRLLADYTDKSATATCMVGYRDGSQIHYISGSITGQIVTPRGDTNFGRDPIFQPDNHTETFAQLDPTTKNTISHRYIAMKKLSGLLT